MNDLTASLTDLKATIENLLLLHQQLKQENKKQQIEIENLRKTTEEQKVKIELLQQKNKEEESNLITETKLKINEFVQEIDSCIALLK